MSGHLLDSEIFSSHHSLLLLDKYIGAQTARPAHPAFAFVLNTERWWASFCRWPDGSCSLTAPTSLLRGTVCSWNSTTTYLWGVHPPACPLTFGAAPSESWYLFHSVFRAFEVRWRVATTTSSRCRLRAPRRLPFHPMASDPCAILASTCFPFAIPSLFYRLARYKLFWAKWQNSARILLMQNIFLTVQVLMRSLSSRYSPATFSAILICFN